MLLGSPVKDPFSKGVAVKDSAQEEDRFLIWIPVLNSVPRRDPTAPRILFGSFPRFSLSCRQSHVAATCGGLLLTHGECIMSKLRRFIDIAWRRLRYGHRISRVLI